MLQRLSLAASHILAKETMHVRRPVISHYERADEQLQIIYITLSDGLIDDSNAICAYYTATPGS